MNINLIIATYGGKYCKINKDSYLKKNLELLNKIKTDITQISIMKPKINSNHEIISDYYNFDNINIDNIKDKIKIFECDNIGISYGQFYTCIFLNRNFDYHIFIEDDYIITTDYFEKELLNIYTNGFLCLYVDYNKIRSVYDLSIKLCEANNILEKVKIIFSKNNLLNYKSITADFSIGIICKNDIDKLFNFYKYEDIIELLNIDFKNYYIHQETFGHILTSCGIDIYDTTKNYKAIFYESSTNQLRLLNNDTLINLKDPLFIPIEIIL